MGFITVDHSFCTWHFLLVDNCEIGMIFIVLVVIFMYLDVDAHLFITLAPIVLFVCIFLLAQQVSHRRIFLVAVR